jgi:hypothetical protein
VGSEGAIYVFTLCHPFKTNATLCLDPRFQNQQQKQQQKKKKKKKKKKPLQLHGQQSLGVFTSHVTLSSSPLLLTSPVCLF